MPAWLRKIVVTSHVTSSVGWLGAVGGFLVLAVAGLESRNSQVVSGAYLSMGLTTWYVILPLALISLATGVVASLGTAWGLFRHYWVLVKLLLTLFITVILLIHVQPIDALAAAAVTARTIDPGLYGAQKLMVIASGCAFLVLLWLTGLSVYKPRGLIPRSAEMSTSGPP